MTIKTFGDSQTTGYGLSGGQGWVSLLTPQNSAHNGDQAADLSNIILGNGGTPLTPNADDTYEIMIGTNDHRKYLSSSAKQEHFKKFLRASIAWLATPAKQKSRDAGVTSTGSWSNTSVNSFGSYSTTQNSTRTFTFSGNSVYVGHIIQDGAGNVGSLAEIRVDGNLVDTITSDGKTNSMTTLNGAAWAIGAERYTGFGSGSHTLEVKVTSVSGKYFYIDFVAGSDQVSTPKFSLSNVVRQTVAGYATVGSSDAIVAQYNTIIDDLITEFTTDGFNVVKVDNHASINPLTHLQSDGLHINAAGNIILASNFASA